MKSDMTEVWVALDVKISFGYQTVGISAGKKTIVPVEKANKEYSRIWDEVESQLHKKIPEAQELVRKLAKMNHG